MSRISAYRPVHMLDMAGRQQNANEYLKIDHSTPKGRSFCARPEGRLPQSPVHLTVLFYFC